MRHRGPLGVGDTLNNRFILEKLVASGGMGVVFKAKDLRKVEVQDRNPYVAIKVLGEDFKEHPDAWIALQREAKKTQGLAHPNIITVYDFDRDHDDVYMTMEFLEGKSLAQLLREAKNEPVETKLAFHIIEGIGRALEHAHEKKIVHSDIKPNNVFLMLDGTIKVLDFGIARVMRQSSAQSDKNDPSDDKTIVDDKTVFDPGDLQAYSRAYASCEIIDNAPADPRDDIYALACIAYELLAGYHPFRGLMATQARDLKIRPEPVKQLNSSQWQVLQRALAFERQQRTSTIHEFLEGMRRSRMAPLVRMAIASGSLMAAVGAVVILGYQIYHSGQIERQGLAMLATFEGSEPEHPSDWLEPISKVHESLRLEPLRDVENVQKRAGELVRKFIGQTDQAIQNKDYGRANVYLELADHLNSDPVIQLEIEKRKHLQLGKRSDVAPPAPQAADVSAHAPAASPVESQLFEFFGRYDSLSMSLPQSVYRQGQLIQLEITVPDSGWLHVFYVERDGKATMIFPHAWSQGNQLEPGDFNLPNVRRLRLSAEPPYGKSWFVAIWDKRPLNLYKISGSASKSKAFFIPFTLQEVLGYWKDRPRDGSLKIGVSEMTVCSAKGLCD